MVLSIAWNMFSSLASSHHDCFAIGSLSGISLASRRPFLMTLLLLTDVHFVINLIILLLLSAVVGNVFALQCFDTVAG